HIRAPGAPGWWGMACSLVGNAALYASLLFGYFFLITMAPGRADAVAFPISIVEALLMALTPGAAVVTLLQASRRTALSSFGLRRGWLLLSAALLAASAALWLWPLRHVAEPSIHAHGATVAVMLAYVGLHCAAGLLMVLFVMARDIAGFISASRSLEPRVVRLWVAYTFFAAITAAAALYAVSASLQ
ncbi:MAG TPA: hypothetical protein VKZ71_05050, partial [Burkholderiaceae bacterium]|nr:hypothetical protein [Burkholderiaceae bacterium]